MMENMVRLLVKRPGCSPELTTVDEDIWAKSRAEILDGLVGGEGRALVVGNFGIVYNMAAQGKAQPQLVVESETDGDLSVTLDIYGPVVLTRLDQTTGEAISLMPVEDLPPVLAAALFDAGEGWPC